jgi:hypothetical protein
MERDLTRLILPFALREKGPGVEGKLGYKLNYDLLSTDFLDYLQR